MVLELDTSKAVFEVEFSKFLLAKRESDTDVNDLVADILRNVRENGDQAVAEYTNQFDRFDLAETGMSFSPDEISAARVQCDDETLDALKLAADRIRDYHARQLPENLSYTDDAGVKLGYRWTAVQAAGLYVPGGTANYPSSVLMNAIPASVAGVERLVMVVPTPDGVVNPLVLAAAELAGVDTVYRIGGAQAVAALAYGTETIAPVDKVVGPGNAYVATAKRQVFGTVGIDMIAGPSEILVVADGDNDPSWIAADLLSQSEHDVAAQSILVTDDATFAARVCEAVDEHLKTLSRSEMAQQSWRDYGAVILIRNLSEASAIVDRVAPEHLELAISDADSFVETIRNAGSIFMGRHTPEAIGDYIAGPNHVLPTARSARFSSGLGVLDFMKRTSIIRCDPDSLAKIGPAASRLANAEGLDAHALSIDIRLE
jgi:histidinol dehydrogenase